MARRRQQKARERCRKIGLLYKSFTRFCSRSCAMYARGANRGLQWAVGDTRVDSVNGYVLVKVSERPTRWRQQHRLVVESLIGRPLEESERVHHKNGDRADNRPENLELWVFKGKDPPGVRMSDSARDALRKLPEQERRKVLAEFA